MVLFMAKSPAKSRPAAKSHVLQSPKRKSRCSARLYRPSVFLVERPTEIFDCRDSGFPELRPVLWFNLKQVETTLKLEASAAVLSVYVEDSQHTVVLLDDHLVGRSY